MECKYCGESDPAKLEFDPAGPLLCAACTYNLRFEREREEAEMNDWDYWEDEEDLDALEDYRAEQYNYERQNGEHETF